jgi:hypothetical protein
LTFTSLPAYTIIFFFLHRLRHLCNHHHHHHRYNLLGMPMNWDGNRMKKKILNGMPTMKNNSIGMLMNRMMIDLKQRFQLKTCLMQKFLLRHGLMQKFRQRHDWRLKPLSKHGSML